MNSEIVQRLSKSLHEGYESAAVVAEAILNGLDQEIVDQIEDMILRANAEREVRELYRKDAEAEVTVLQLKDEEPELFTEMPRRQEGKK
jgi:hypothetical protein